MIFGLLIAVLIVALFLYAALNGKSFRLSGRPVEHRPQRHIHAASLSREQIVERWAKIEASANQGEHGLRHAVTEADKLLDQAMRQAGFAGETMAERLKKAEHRLSDKEAVWQAHKIRNAIAHDVNYDLLASRGQQAVRDLGRALKDLGAL